MYWKPVFADYLYDLTILPQHHHHPPRPPGMVPGENLRQSGAQSEPHM